MNLRLFALIILLITGDLAAQGPATWLPEFPVIGDSILISFDPAKSSPIPDTTPTLVLHWGVNETSAGAWNPPPADLRPAGSVLHTDNKAVRSPMAKNGPVWQLRIPTDARISTVHFVVNTGTPASPGPNWDNNDNRNWNITLTEEKIRAIFSSPESDNQYGDLRRSPAFVAPDGSLEIVGTAGVNNTALDSLKLFIGTEQVKATDLDTLKHIFNAAGYPAGFQELRLVASDTSGVSDTAATLIMVNPVPKDLLPPAGIIDGINYVDEQTVVLSLFAPYKDFVYLLGDFNDWMVDTTYFMHRQIIDADSIRWWIRLENLTTLQEYAYQYLINGDLRIADPYTAKVLDPWHDEEIIEKGLYPGLKPYPDGKTSDHVAVLQTAQTGYQWQFDETFLRPKQSELIVYELLIRDFLARHDYSTLIDTLDYFERLGINAIELMPVNEFEGNSSWGYNPSFYFAPDKFYGPADSLKRFVDECHKRGIAVIIDMVLNHSYGQSPLVRLYFANGKVTSENPWYNISAPHTDFSWGYDFNHERTATRNFVHRVNRYWLEEYKIDGFRFDFTRGFTNRQGTSGGYDASRIAILENMADQIWAVDSTAYVILEHLIDSNDEMRELAHYKQGMMLWANANYNYNEATMGYNDSGKSDFSWGFYKTRPGWTKPNLVTYMESHDEERLMFKNLQYGNSSGGYDIKHLETALNRMKLAGAFFFTYPGAKMLWQLGELGYDISIDDPCRLCAKDPNWQYYQDDLRLKLYKTYAALIQLRRTVPAFTSADAGVELSVSGAAKRIRITHPSMNVIIIGNFDVIIREIVPDFYYSGTWYDYFSGEAVTITDAAAEIVLEPGEFHIYTSKKLPTPEEDILNAIPPLISEQPDLYTLEQNYPNPFNPITAIKFQLADIARVELTIFDILGREVARLVDGIRPAGSHQIMWSGTDHDGIRVSSGVYIYRLKVNVGESKIFEEHRKMILLR